MWRKSGALNPLCYNDLQFSERGFGYLDLIYTFTQSL